MDEPLLDLLYLSNLSYIALRRIFAADADFEGAPGMTLMVLDTSTNEYEPFTWSDIKEKFAVGDRALDRYAFDLRCPNLATHMIRVCATALAERLLPNLPPIISVHSWRDTGFVGIALWTEFSKVYAPTIFSWNEDGIGNRGLYEDKVVAPPNIGMSVYDTGSTAVLVYQLSHQF